MITKRRICWPNPDATCLEGGCGFCNAGAWKPISIIETYAKQAGIVRHRGNGARVDAWDAYIYGRTHLFHNAATK